MAEIASAFVTLAPSAKGFGSKLEREVGPEVDGAGKRLGSGFGKVFAVAGGLLAAAGIGSFLKDSVAEAREAAKVGALTESTIKSMGLAGKVTANQISRMAASISRSTAIDDEAIQSGQNLLLTFGNVAASAGELGGVFDQTTALAVDMSAALGQDMKSSAIQLGKALNDPIKGVSALGRVGVSFTEDQKALIKSLVDSGKLAKAQGVILKEVGKQFGGAAAAMATPADKARVAFGNLKEDIGTALLPMLDRLAMFTTDTVIPKLRQFGGFIRSEVVPKVQEFASKLRAKLEPALRSAAAYIRDQLIPKLRDFAQAVREKAAPAVDFLREKFEALKPKFQEFVSNIRDGMPGAIEKFVALRDALADISRTIYEKFKPIFDQLVKDFREDVKPAFDDLVQAIKDDLKPAFDDLMEALDDPAIRDLTKLIGGLVLMMIYFTTTVLARVLPVIARLVLAYGVVWVGAISAGTRALARGIEGFSNAKAAFDQLVTVIRGFAANAVVAFNDFLAAARALPGKVKRALSIMVVDALNTGQQLIASMASGVVIGSQKLANAAVDAVRRAIAAAKAELLRQVASIPLVPDKFAGAGKGGRIVAPSDFSPSSFDGGGFIAAAPRRVVVSIGGRDFDGYLDERADDRVSSAHDLSMEASRAAWSRR